MSYFPGMKLTKLGEQLLAKINGNSGESLFFKKAELGSGEINSDEEIRNLTSLKSKWKEVSVTECSVTGIDKTQIQIDLQFDNVGLTTNKIFREIGIYASGNDGREVLFAYSNAKANYDYIPSVSDSPQCFLVSVFLTITSNVNIEATVDLNSYITLEKFISTIKALMGNNYQGGFKPNNKYYPGDIYYKKDSTIVGVDIPNVSSPAITRTCKVENIKKFFRLYGGQELEFNFTGNGDNKVVGIAIEDSNKLIRTNSCINFELNTIDYTIAIDIPVVGTPELIKTMTTNQDNSSTTIIKRQIDLPVWGHYSQSNPALRKFNY